ALPALLDFPGSSAGNSLFGNPAMASMVYADPPARATECGIVCGIVAYNRGIGEARSYLPAAGLSSHARPPGGHRSSGQSPGPQQKVLGGACAEDLDQLVANDLDDHQPRSEQPGAQSGASPRSFQGAGGSSPAALNVLAPLSRADPLSRERRPLATACTSR